MGKKLVFLVMDALAGEGIPVCRAFSGRRMHIPVGLTAAVQLAALDQAKETATVLISVIVPAKVGAEVCEDGALEICRIIQKIGGLCRQERSGYHKDGDVFAVEIFAAFSGQETESGWQETPPPEPEPELPAPETFQVYINGLHRPYVAWVKAHRAIAEEAPDLSGRPWSFELEEVYPLEIAEGALPVDGFTLEMVRGGRREILRDCVLQVHTRDLRENGQHQILKGVASSLVAG